MDNKDSSIGLSCPPKPFVEQTVLENVSKVISDSGKCTRGNILCNFNYVCLRFFCRKCSIEGPVFKASNNTEF